MSTANAPFSHDIDTLGVGQRRLKAQFFPAMVTVFGADDTTRLEERLMIRFPILGEATVPAREAVERDKQLYADAWRAYTEGRAAPLNGTPLEELPGVTERVCKVAALREIRTIEDMASEQAALSMPDGRMWQAKAKAWLEQKAGSAALDQAAAVAAMQAQIEKMADLMQKLQAQNEAKDAVISALKGASGQPVEHGPVSVERQEEDALAALSDAMSDGDGIVTDLDAA